MSAPAIRLLKKNAKGLFAVYKMKGLSCADTAAHIQLQLHHELECRFIKFGFVVSYSGVLDKESHGVMACRIAKVGGARKKAYKHGFAKYEIAAKLGSETDNHHANGIVVDEKPYDHITEENINAAIKKFVGTITQLQPEEYYGTCALDSNIFRDPGVEHRKIFNRSILCEELLCTSFHPPDISFKLSCSANVDVASLIKDIGKELGTCTHVLDAKRTVHGPFTLQDALPKYQWSWKCIQEAINARKDNNMGLRSLAG